jgi:ribosome-binding protein aMBF1 (putative translation factor)
VVPSVNPFWVYPIKGSILTRLMSSSLSSPHYKRFRELLVQARKGAGLSQSELSSRLNRPQSFISKYERGERRLDVIEFAEVCRALEIDPIKSLAKLYREIS